MDGISVESRCEYCNQGVSVGWSKLRNRPVHAIPNTRNEFVACKNYDDECRHIGAGFGWYTFAWLPTKCRNGKWRWLTWLEKHADMLGRTYYTLGNRAH